MGMKKPTDSSRKNKIYGNCKVYSPEGKLMFLCLEKRAKWYMDATDSETGKPMAKEIRSINPLLNFIMERLSIKPRNPKIQLLFNPKNAGNFGDKFSLSKKLNRCVVTGSYDINKLTKHHITPYYYRKFMPEVYKKSNSHDVVPILIKNHCLYEKEADKLKAEIAIKYNAPLKGHSIMNNHELFYAIKSAKTLKIHMDSMPSVKVNEFKKNIRNYTGQKKVTQKIIDDLAAREFKECQKIKSHGELVVDKLNLGGDEAFQEFVEMWRKHFVEITKPKYMPKHWRIDRPASKVNIETN